MTIENYITLCPNYFNGRKGYIPDIIVLHNTGGLQISSAHYWFIDSTSQTSSHYLVGLDGEVRQYVDLANGAWCCGTSIQPDNKAYYQFATNPIVQSRAYNANLYSVNIEFVGNVGDKLSEAQIKTTVELFSHIKQQIKRLYGTELLFDRSHVMGHYEVAPKTRGYCGKEIQYDDILSRFDIVDYLTPSTLTPDPAPVTQTSTAETNPLTSDIPVVLQVSKARINTNIISESKVPSGIQKTKLNLFEFKPKE